MLVRLIYASRSTAAINAQLTDVILKQSKVHNPQRGVTGILCFTEDTFIQVLEGSRSEVSALYNEIVRDTRHKDIELLGFEEIKERQFAHWTMGEVNLAKVNPATLLKYAPKPKIDPFAMSGDQCLSLLEELLSLAAICGR
ncbi:BLUF domain-containing protein [Leeia sp. TBRC 13508]|uniref:BLUF domain-containing protein n=1 Tax=Leeia speluncae TaxID=2884804 RepID=A0ABS8D8L9_9NEIS|nr:BLUF domain-containing protein [Leeia speluncae]MCB6184550.1 BLUF domain-containing protein [Leeia speluncae]